MKNIIALCDYQNRFGSKYFDYPYRSGMDKDHLVKQFRKYDWNLTYVNPASLTRESHPHDVPVIYTAQEDSGYRYKSFIEDIVFGLELSGYMTLPSYKYLRANNNKIFMEILRELLLPEKYQNSSKYFGCLEELQSEIGIIEFPCVIKTAEGAGSRGVYLAKKRAEILTIAKKVSRSMSLYHEMWDWGRRFCHKGYRRESTHRNKFIVQNYIPGLINDWKVLVFFDKYYVLRRENRPRDFRASGSGLFSFDERVDQDLLSAASEINGCFDVPMISLDLAKKDETIYLIEMQFIYFGTSTLEKSPYYYRKTSNGFEQVHSKSVLEDEYARSISEYLRTHV